MKKFCSLLLAAAMAVCTVTPLTAAADETAENAPAAAGQATAETAETSAPAETLELPVLAQPSALEQMDEQDQNPAQPSALEQLAAQFEALPTVEQLMSMSAEEMDEAMVSVGTALDAFNALSDADAAAFQQAYPDLYQKVMVELNGALNANVSTMSLEPMKTYDAYLVLQGYTQEELQNVPVDDVISRMVDENKNPITVDENATTAWFYYTYQSEDGREEVHSLNNGETIDLSGYMNSYQNLIVVVGNGDQTDAEHNVRYELTVYTYEGSEYSLWMNFNYSYDVLSEPAYFEDVLGMQGYELGFPLSSEENSYNLSIYAYMRDILSFNGITMDIYPVSNFLAYRDEGEELTGAITEPLFSSDGYDVDYSQQATAETCMSAPNVWVVTFTDDASDTMIGYFGLACYQYVSPVNTSGAIWTATGEADQQVSYLWLPKFNYSYVDIDIFNSPDNRSIDVQMPLNYNTYTSYTSIRLPEGYSNLDQYSIRMEDTSWAKAIYLGVYYSEQAAVDADAEDLKDILASEEGYVGCFEDVVYFTVIMEDGRSFRTGLRLTMPDESTSQPDDTDIYFNIYGAETSDGSLLSSYVADEAGSIPLDTYYRGDEKYDVDGYQLLLINSELSEEEIKSLIPRFSVPDGVKVSSGSLSEIKSGVTSLKDAQWSETIPDTVMLQVHLPSEEVKNYQVTFVTKQPENTAPKDQLFVAGPDERYVNLNAENNYVHDILLANLGADPLTGVEVELVDPVHVKLDNYWTINEHMTLPAFDSVSTWYTDEQTSEQFHSSYTTIANVAKVRLLADGTGEISGTLRFSVGGEVVREIKLTGVASAPHIVNTELPEGVKYVPYSCMIATDNMYTWNRTTFSIVKGELPEGLEFYGNTGEIYGTPQESGTFPLTIQVDFSSPRFESTSVDLELVVQDNTNENVYMATDDGYEIETHLGEEQGTGTYDFLLTDYDTDQLFVSTADIYGFQGLWLNGQELEPGVDYTVVRGSTRVTIYAQTFEDKGIMGGANTIAAEFRTTDGKNELKRTAQNFRLPDLSEEEDGSGGNGGQGGSGGQGNSGGQDGSGNTATVTVTGSGSSAGQVSGQAAANAAGTANGSTVPQTSDSLPYTLCVVLALVSACGLAGLVI